MLPNPTVKWNWIFQSVSCFLYNTLGLIVMKRRSQWFGGYYSDIKYYARLDYILKFRNYLARFRSKYLKNIYIKSWLHTSINKLISQRNSLDVKVSVKKKKTCWNKRSNPFICGSFVVFNKKLNMCVLHLRNQMTSQFKTNIKSWVENWDYMSL